MQWSEWRRLEPAIRLSPSVLKELLDGGQAFRWHRRDSGIWTGQWADVLVRVRVDEEGFLCWQAPLSLISRNEPRVRRYFAAGTAFTELADQLPWRSDPVLAGAIQGFAGLRLLRQPLSETLLAFLCSATKQIVQIKQMLSLLAERHGNEIWPGYRSLPGWETLATLEESELRACALGFRARYIKATALMIAEDPECLNKIEELPYPEAKEWIMKFPGVGEKVADCVLLFGAGKYEAFPVDVWIFKVMRNRYGLNDWTNTQIFHFARIHFGSNAGLAQQFLFAHERARRSQAPPRSV